MSKLTFVFVKDFSQSGYKVGDKIQFTSLPFHLREYLQQVGEEIKKEKIAEAKSTIDKPKKEKKDKGKKS